MALEEEPAVCNCRKKMIIAVAIEDPVDSSLLSESFGKSKFFLVYDLDNNSESILTNPFVTELGRAGIQSARLLIENNVDAVITKKIGINPFRFFTSINIKVFQCKQMIALKAIQLFRDKKLSEFENICQYFSAGRTRRRYGINNFINNNSRNKKGYL